MASKEKFHFMRRVYIVFPEFVEEWNINLTDFSLEKISRTSISKYSRLFIHNKNIFVIYGSHVSILDKGEVKHMKQ
jgi:hypothetical protein